jgi:acyl carrier protein
VDASKEEITRWCQEYVADLLQVPTDSIDPEASFDKLGIDSAVAVSLLIDVEERYGVEVAPESLFANPTISAVASILHQQAAPSVP